YWRRSEGRAAKLLATVHGIAMSATRIVGIPCAAFPVVRDVFRKGWSALRNPRRWLSNYGSAVAVMIGAIFGAIFFFVYCQWRWGRWDMYMLTQSAGWNIEPDYLAVFRPSNYRWLFPALNDPTQMSQMSMTFGALLLIAIAVVELLPSIRRRTELSTRIGIYFCAAVIYYISVSGVASLYIESMLRYDIGVHRLLWKSIEGEDLWTEILPNDMLQRTRSSKIYYVGKFFTYPLKPFEALIKLGIVRSTICVLSWLKARLFPVRHPRNFEEWVSNQFGKRLFNIFFKSYTEKVWGMSCKEISADWDAQRIRGLSLGSAIKNALLPRRCANWFAEFVRQFRTAPGALPKV